MRKQKQIISKIQLMSKVLTKQVQNKVSRYLLNPTCSSNHSLKKTSFFMVLIISNI